MMKSVMIACMLASATALRVPSAKHAAAMLGVDISAMTSEEIQAKALEMRTMASKGHVTPALKARFGELSRKRNLAELTCDNEEEFMTDLLDSKECSDLKSDIMNEKNDIVCNKKANADNCACMDGFMSGMDIDCGDDDDDDDDDDDTMPCGLHDMWVLKCDTQAGIMTNMMMCMSTTMGLMMSLDSMMMSIDSCKKDGVMECAAGADAKDVTCDCVKDIAAAGMTELFEMAHVTCGNLEKMDAADRQEMLGDDFTMVEDGSSSSDDGTCNAITAYGTCDLAQAHSSGAGRAAVATVAFLAVMAAL